MTPLRAVKGMNDVLPDEIGQWQRVEAAFARTMALHRFREVRTPFLEPTPLFVRTIGEVTDIVEKEMYSFTHHDEALTLRPEGTAGAARAYVQHKVHNSEPVTRWYYAGPMFRAERPQRGRYRQFYQLGAEIFGDPGPACDAEMIDMLVGFLDAIGIRGDVEVLVNSLGGPETRARYREALVAFLEPRKALLSETSQRRLATNPLRILDSKSKQDQDTLAGAPTIHDSFDDADRDVFEALEEHLRALGTPFRVDSNLVRGLDYYNHTIFEIKGAGEKLGAGNTLVAGGRYNGMVRELGGPPVPAIGFAAGLERLVIASDLPAAPHADFVLVAPLGEKATAPALVLARELRRAGIACEADTRGGSLKNMLGRADKLSSRMAIILGDDEIAANVVQVKDLAAQTQERVERARAVSYVAERLGIALSVVALLVATLVSRVSYAQMGTPSMGGAGGRGNNTPTQSGPVQNRSVGPRAGAGANDDEDNTPTVSQRTGEPLTAPPANPLAVPPEVKDRIGTDADIVPPAPVGERQRSYFPYYEERKGDYRFRFLPPLYLEYTRGLSSASPPVAGEPTREDRQSLYALLFYQRRSPLQDMDVLFPLAWHVRDVDNQVYVFGPLAHREAPGEHDNWFAPLFFEGERKDGGYFHSPLLLTTSHWNADKAFELTLLYFRDRRGSDLDWGVAPFFFKGDNGNIDGARRTYTLIPPLFYYHREKEIDDSKLTIVGPVVLRTTPKRSITDVAPLFFHIEGHPENGGIRESHTTLFPLFHYGYADDEKHETLFVAPGYLHRTTTSVNTMLTPLFSHSSTRNGATQLYAVGPVLPIVWSYRDKDVNQTSFAVLPLVYHSHSPLGTDWLTPLFGRFENYGVSRTYWAFPTFVLSEDTHGWESDLLPIAFLGRSDKATHAVLAPILWDFANPKGRVTIGFPFYWRFGDSTDDSVTQVAGNTVFLQKRVAGGIDWQFHVLPLVSYGGVPNGHWWNFLFGLAGYSHDTDGTQTVRVLWIPIKVHGADAPQMAKRARGRDPAYHGARF